MLLSESQDSMFGIFLYGRAEYTMQNHMNDCSTAAAESRTYDFIMI